MSDSAPRITLFASPVSDCSARLRIALRLKDLSFAEVLQSHSQSKGNVIDAQLNPACTVPTLVIKHSENTASVTLTQSIAALEYLDEAFPRTKQLLPDHTDPKARAEVRRLVQIVATDIHPLTTCRVSERLLEVATGAKNYDWEVHWIRKGLEVFETLVSQTAGRYCVGDKATMADVCLMPQLWTARKFGFDITQLPTVHGIFARLSQVPAFKEDAHPITVL